MKLFIKKNAQFIIYGLCALVFLILAFTIKVDEKNGFAIFTLFSEPFDAVGNAIRALGLSGGFSSVLAYAIYILFCLLPLVYPVIDFIKNRKLKWSYIFFAAACVFLFVATYYFINPHKIATFVDKIPLDGASDTILVEIGKSKQQLRLVIKLSMAIVFWGLIILAVLFEIGSALNNHYEKIYFTARRLIDLFIVYLIYSACFVLVFSARSSIVSIAASIEQLNASYEINVLVIVITSIISAVPLAFEGVLLFNFITFTHSLENDAFRLSNVAAINKIEKTAKITLLVIIAASIINSIINLIFGAQLINVNTSINVPFELILVVCLLIIFSKILARAITINEENKLVI